MTHNVLYQLCIASGKRQGKIKTYDIKGLGGGGEGGIFTFKSCIYLALTAFSSIYIVRSPSTLIYSSICNYVKRASERRS